jgi:hypothetical protein
VYIADAGSVRAVVASLPGESNGPAGAGEDKPGAIRHTGLAANHASLATTTWPDFEATILEQVGSLNIGI